MKFLRIFFAAVVLALAIPSAQASVYETNNTPCVIKTITIAEEYGYYDWSGWVSWTNYWDVTLAYGETFSIDDVYGYYDETHYNVVASSESPDPGCSGGGGGGETWEAFDEAQGWSYGSWSPDASGYAEWEWVDQERTNTQWHYYGERSNLNNVRNDGWYQETSTEYQSVPGGTSANWQSFEEVITDWHETSCSPDPSLYWEDETFTQNYDEERTVRRGERDQWGNEQNVSVDTEVWSGSRPASGSRPLNWQSFEEVVSDWSEVSSSPDPANYWEDQTFSQSYTEERTVRSGERSQRGDERAVTVNTESRGGSRQVSGTMPLNWHSFEAVTVDWHDVSSSPSTDNYQIGTQFTQNYTEQRTMRGGQTNDRGDESGVSTWTESRSDTRTAEGTANTAPSASISGSNSLAPGVTGSWSFSASDVNGNLKRWRFHSSTNPAPQWTYNIPGEFVSGSYSTAWSEPGDYTWVVDVEDESGATDSVSITVRVEVPNHAPTASLDLTPNVVLTNDHVAVVAHVHDEEGNFDAMGVRWLTHDLRQWWNLGGSLIGSDTSTDRSRSYSETMAVPAGTEYLRGEVWDTTPSGSAGDWQPVVVLGTWVPNVAVTPVTPKVSGTVKATYSDAPDSQTWIGIFRVGDPNGSPIRSWTVGSPGNGTHDFSLGSPDFMVGQDYHVRMFAMGSYGLLATSNTFHVVADTPVFTLAVHGGTVAGHADEDGNSSDGVSHTSGWHTSDVVTIVAIPVSGQSFNHWSMATLDNGTAGNGAIGGATSSTATFTIGTTDGAVRAIFNGPPPTYLVTVTGGHAVPAGPQPEGTVLAVTADPPAGQMLSSWTKNGPGTLASSTDATTTFQVGGGAATITATFVTNPLPVIINQPVNRNSLPGATATFSVVASAPGSITYQWLKNGVALVNGNNVNSAVVSGATTAALTLTGVQTADIASYSVRVANSQGSVSSISVFLVIGPNLRLHRPQ